MIPLDAIDSIKWHAEGGSMYINLLARYWYKKKEKKKERLFKFGMDDLKVVKEFQSALHFLIFKMK